MIDIPKVIEFVDRHGPFVESKADKCMFRGCVGVDQGWVWEELMCWIGRMLCLSGLVSL